MWSIDACPSSYFLTFSLVFFLLNISIFLCLSMFSFLSSTFCFLASPFTVHGYPLLYYLSLWNLPILSLNRFWLLVGISPGLPTNLPVVQSLPLPRVCWLHHSPFPNKITCLVSYLSLFLFHLNR